MQQNLLFWNDNKKMSQKRNGAFIERSSIFLLMQSIKFIADSFEEE